MASATRAQALRPSTRRGLEWSLLLIIVVLVAGYYVREFRFVQGQGEAAAVKTTLGALRTALLIDHLKGVVDGTPPGRPVQANPFLLLDHVPANYAGALGRRTVQVQQEQQERPVQQAGTWVFDADCHCIGYWPLYPQGLNTPTDAPALWFRISKPPGPLQIRAMQRYVWQGQLVD